MHRILFWSIWLSIAFVSCAPTLTVPLVRPPEINLGERPEYTIIVVNRYDTSLLDFNQVKKNMVFALSSEYLHERLEYELNSVANFEVFDNDIKLSGELHSHSAPHMHKDSIRAYCKEYNSSHLVAIESYHADFEQEVDVQENEDGSKTRTAYYTLYVRSGLAIYDSTGKTHFRKSLKRSMLYDTRGVVSGLLAVGPTINKADEELKVLVEDLAKDFILRFYPSEALLVQKFYGGSDFKEEVKLMKWSKWAEAIKRMTPVDKYGDEQTKGKACYNIALCYKFLSDEENATAYYLKAQDYLESNLKYQLPE